MSEPPHEPPTLDEMQAALAWFVREELAFFNNVKILADGTRYALAAAPRLQQLMIENARLRKIIDGQLDEYLKAYRAIREETR